MKVILEYILIFIIFGILMWLICGFVTLNLDITVYSNVGIGSQNLHGARPDMVAVRIRGQDQLGGPSNPMRDNWSL